MEGAWALFDSLRANQSLLWLGIGGNSLGDRGVLHLVAVLQGRYKGEGRGGEGRGWRGGEGRGGEGRGGEGREGERRGEER